MLAVSCSRCEEEPVRSDGATPRLPADGQETKSTVKLVDLKGEVERLAADGTWQPVKEGQEVSLGDRLRSASGVAFVVEFGDGGRVRIEGEAELKMADADAELALLMEEGRFELEVEKAGPRGYQVIFSDTSDVVMLNTGRVGLTKKEGGVAVEMFMGNATILQAGQKVALTAGTTYELTFGRAEIVDRVPLETTLRDRRRASRIRPPDARSFRRPPRRTMKLEPGTDLRTSPRAAVEWHDPAGGRVVLSPRSRARFEGSFEADQGREGLLRLESGEARIALRREGAGPNRQEVITPHAKVTLRATGLTSEANVSAKKKTTRVVVHTGLAEIAVGDKTVTVKAGQNITVDPRSPPARAQSAPPARVQAQEGKRTRVFYDRLPRLGLSWNHKPGEQVILELADSASFDKLILREPLDTAHFAHPKIKSGTTFWRLVRSDGTRGPTGSVNLRKDPMALGSSSGKLRNIVPDTGIQTTVLFQHKVPALTFTWDALENVTSYQVRIYSEDNMDEPHFQTEVQEARLILAAGKLEEGTYFWYKTGRDARGQEVKTSWMNKLVLAFDNTAPILRIDAPRPGQKPSGGKVEVRGLAATGVSVEVNGQPLELGANGRFQQTLTGVGRNTLLVFRVKKPGLGDVIFTRQLGR